MKNGSEAVPEGGREWKRKYKAVEKRIAKEIREIEAMIFFRPRLPAMKLRLDWEKAALLSYDRNALIQLGVLQSYFEMEAWMDWLLKDRLAGVKGGVPFARKRDLLKKTLKLPSSVSRFLAEVERVKNALSSHLPGTKRRPLPRYRGRPILDLATFKRFLSASRLSGDTLVRRLVKGK